MQPNRYQNYYNIMTSAGGPDLTESYFGQAETENVPHCRMFQKEIRT
jgi:hypothetical protein